MSNTITIQQIEPFPAWAKLYAKMQKQFAQEYNGTIKGSQFKQATRNDIAMKDITKKYCWWICLNGKKIGFINAPDVYQNGVKKYKYLDTRFILPEHRANGIGSKAFALLQDQHYVTSIKMKTDYLATNWQYWHKRGYGHAVMAGLIDSEHKDEILALGNRNNFQMDEVEFWSMFHWYLMDSNGAELENYKKLGLPVIETGGWFGKNKIDYMTALPKQIRDAI